MRRKQFTNSVTESERLLCPFPWGPGQLHRAVAVENRVCGYFYFPILVLCGSVSLSPRKGTRESERTTKQLYLQLDYSAKPTLITKDSHLINAAKLIKEFLFSHFWSHIAAAESRSPSGKAHFAASVSLNSLQVPKGRICR